MDKTEYRAVIKFLVLEGQSSKQVEERLTSVYGQSSPSSSTIKRWVKEFQRGRESLEDDPRSGRPTTSTSPENIEKVHKLVIENRRISLYELEEATGIFFPRDVLDEILNLIESVSEDFPSYSFIWIHTQHTS